MSAVVGVLRGHAEVEEEMLLPDLRFEVGPEKMGVLGRGTSMPGVERCPHRPPAVPVLTAGRPAPFGTL